MDCVSCSFLFIHVCALYSFYMCFLFITSNPVPILAFMVTHFLHSPLPLILISVSVWNSAAHQLTMRTYDSRLEGHTHFTITFKRLTSARVCFFIFLSMQSIILLVLLWSLSCTFSLLTVAVT